MSGQELYQQWVVAMANEGVEVDPWENLGDVEKNAWDEVASNVSLVTPVEREEE